MKLEIFDTLEQTIEEPVRLRLQRDGGCISVVAVDKLGDSIPSGFLIGFNPDGTITRHRGVSARAGFQLGKGNRIKEHGE